jgi:hypothetical protein
MVRNRLVRGGFLFLWNGGTITRYENIHSPEIPYNSDNSVLSAILV